MIEKVMDNESKNSEENCNVDEVNLPEIMLGLQQLTVDTNTSLQPCNNRILRKRLPRVMYNETINRRCGLKPRKRSHNDMENDDDIKEYYLDKNVKKVSNNLETIYEESEDMSETSVRIGSKRLKRLIQFKIGPSASKVKKRQAKIKKLGSKRNYKKKIAMQTVIDKLNGIRSHTVSHTIIESDIS